MTTGRQLNRSIANGRFNSVAIASGVNADVMRTNSIIDSPRRGGELILIWQHRAANMSLCCTNCIREIMYGILSVNWTFVICNYYHTRPWSEAIPSSSKLSEPSSSTGIYNNQLVRGKEGMGFWLAMVSRRGRCESSNPLLVITCNQSIIGGLDVMANQANTKLYNQLGMYVVVFWWWKWQL